MSTVDTSSRFLSRRTTAGLLLSGACVTAAGFVATPWEDEQTTRAYLGALAESATRAQVSAVLLHVGYLLLAAGAFGLLAVLGRRGGRIGVIGGVLTLLGATTMPGLLVTDAYDLALARELPRDTAVEVSDAVGELAMSTIIFLPALVGFVLGGILLVVALWRVGEVPAVVPALVLLGWLVPMAGFDPTLIVAGGLVLVAAYALLAARLWRTPEESLPRRDRRPRAPAGPARADAGAQA
ncbi:hypothetical protein AB0L40_04485 [Patulibacter sp. NPDC049589]|uniref:hypothetical protein n=1 Tax=Patulibacter sp. NPDC049589 TaxID=3154731 RepID=UPI00342688C5